MSDDEILNSARKRFQLSADAESEIREDMLNDLKFYAGHQWDEQILQQRRAQGRPALVTNRLPQFVHQITNEQRQNRPSIQVNPVGDGADVDTAEVEQGLIRHIEYNSGADMAYDSAFESAVISGIGFFRLTTDYVGPNSFQQEILIKRVQNPFSVYFDPGVTEADYSDASFCFVTETYTKEDFNKRWPKKADGAPFNLDATGDGWIDKDRVRVAEYFWIEEKTQTLHLFSDGSTYLEGRIPVIRNAGVVEVAKRKVQIPTVHWALITGQDVLETTEWPGKWIPVIPVIGKELYIDGKRILKGIVRDGIDAQQQVNFMTSAATEGIALMPRAPFIGTAKNFENYEREWQSANTTNRPFLRYNPDQLNGLAAPQRTNAQPQVEAMMQAVAVAQEDLKAVTGIYDAALGNRSNEISGKGILARQQQSQSGNFHYIDNLSRSLRHAGRCILDLIPKIYDTERIVRIIMPDGEQKMVTINQAKGPNGQLPPGVDKVFDLTVGTYDVEISVGPSYQTKRQESVMAMLQLAQTDPKIMNVAGDLLIKEMDFPGAAEIAERVQRTIPANVLNDPQELMQGLNPQQQQAFSQMQSQLQQAEQQNQQLQQEIKMQLAPKTLEAESRERIEFEKLAIEREKIQSDLAVALATIDAKRAELAISHQLVSLDSAIAADQQGVLPQQLPQQPMQQPMPSQMQAPAPQQALPVQ